MESRFDVFWTRCKRVDNWICSTPVWLLCTFCPVEGRLDRSCALPQPRSDRHWNSEKLWHFLSLCSRGQRHHHSCWCWGKWQLVGPAPLCTLSNQLHRSGLWLSSWGLGTVSWTIACCPGRSNSFGSDSGSWTSRGFSFAPGQTVKKCKRRPQRRSSCWKQKGVVLSLPRCLA